MAIMYLFYLCVYTILAIVSGVAKSVILSKSKLEHCIKSENNSSQIVEDCKNRIFVQFAVENDQVTLLNP
jgi:hypothetical protein